MLETMTATDKGERGECNLNTTENLNARHRKRERETAANPNLLHRTKQGKKAGTIRSEVECLDRNPKVCVCRGGRNGEGQRKDGAPLFDLYSAPMSRVNMFLSAGRGGEAVFP